MNTQLHLIEKAKALLAEIRTKSFSKKYIYQIEQMIFTTITKEVFERNVIKEEGVL